jgi:hypothetical protein
MFLAEGPAPATNNSTLSLIGSSDRNGRAGLKGGGSKNPADFPW